MFSKILDCICQQVELRAFCSKHTKLPSDRDTHQLGEAFVSARYDCSAAYQNPSTVQMDKLTVHTETSDTNSGKPGDGELREIGLFDSRSNAAPLSESGDVDKLIDVGIFERGYCEGASTDSRDLLLILKTVLKIKLMCSCFLHWFLLLRYIGIASM